jgi:uncharacterized SAM-binding protein YcdF (DUF218 family)
VISWAFAVNVFISECCLVNALKTTESLGLYGKTRITVKPDPNPSAVEEIFIVPKRLQQLRPHRVCPGIPVITAFIATWLLPPVSPLLLVLAGLWLLRTNRRAGCWLIAGATGALLLLATPIVGLTLNSSVEAPYADPLLEQADAIVVLGGGSSPAAPEYGGDTVNGTSLERLRYAATLQRRSGKPLLVSGGNPRGNATSEADQMQAILQNEWHVPVKWSETTSGNTLENARNSYAILQRADIRRIYLVTHAWHMPRARQAFEQAGFVVIPAATQFTTRTGSHLADFLPGIDGLALSTRVAYEILGSIWYRLRSL